uniref:Uncharacterized protein n=1 Tax=Panagrolaimus sp. ES5 TaxID=591445 RepID=A0AC34G9D6_9BILA
MSKCYTNTSCSKFDRYGTKISAQGVMQIRVNYFDFSENSRVSILSESIETVVTKVGQIITVKDDATIFMEEREDNHGQVLFEIEVLSSDAQEQSTTPTDSSGDKNNANASTSWMPLLFTFFISVLLYSLS